MKAGLRDVDVKGKKVLVRVDLNVPLTPDGKVADDTRIRAILPTVNYLREQGAKIALVSHLGRPKGKVVEELRMKPVGERLSQLLNTPVVVLQTCIGEEVEKNLERMNPGDVLLLENVRFYPGEEKNDPEFAKQLAKPFDIFVNDAFGTCHRAHASTAGVTKFLPSVAGFLLEKEIQALSQLLESPQKPFVIVLGGVKLETKIPIIENLLDKADSFLIGGAMAYTFIKASGRSIGKSYLEEDKIPLAKEIMKKASKKGVDFVLPEDHVVTNVQVTKPPLPKGAKVKTVPRGQIPEDWEAVDIGPKTRKLYASYIKNASTVFWNGPMGIFEIEKFSKGTVAIAKAMASCKGTTVIGGGDSISAVKKAKVEDKITHISTGGGASLEFLGGKKLPGIEALWDLDKIRGAL